MGSDAKVLPVADAFTAVRAISDGELEDGNQSALVVVTHHAVPEEETAVEVLQGNVGDASELRKTSDQGSLPAAMLDSVGSVAPHNAIQARGFANQQPPVIKNKSAASLNKSAQLKRTGTLQVLSLGPQLSKSDLKAKQKAEIERKGEPRRTHSLRDRAVYNIDKYISTRKGQTITLAVLGLVLMFIGACILKASQPSQQFHEMVWQSWTFLGDSGSHTALTDTGLRIIGVVMALVGILYFSVIMGFVVDGIRDKMDSLKKGKSKVVEDKHTLMLGWTDKSISMIRQLCLANASEKGGVVIVLADRDKEELEAELASQLQPHEMLGTKVIFRTGSHMLSVDLLKVAAHRARSIVILAQTAGDADRADASVLRTVLGLKTLPEISGHIVAELRDIDNEPLVRLVGGDDVEVVVSHDIIGRLVLMAARSPGLARVFTCLLGFDGNEFYFKEWPECVGVRFGDLIERFPNAIPFGIKRRNGDVLIAPKSSVALEGGDQVMVLAEDDDTYKACPPAHIDCGDLPTAVRKSMRKEKILMCGWRRDIRDMIQLLDSLVLPGTELHMVCEEPCHLRNKILVESGLDVNALQNLRIVHHYGNTAIRRHLEILPLHTFTSLLVLADGSREDDIMHSDSHTLASLLLVRDLQASMIKKAGRIVEAEESCRCICEVLDPRTQRTISTSETILKLSEFIQSNEIISCILAMVSESRDVRVILDELLGADGASFEIEPFTKYCSSAECISFWQIAKRAMKLDEIVCGFQNRGAVEQTILNPVDKANPRTWGGVDFIILRQRSKEPIVHQQDPQQMQAEEFERTSLNRMGKSALTRQHLLEELVQEQEATRLENARIEEEQFVSRIVSSFNDGLERTASASFDADSVRALVTVTRLLADTLSQLDSTRTERNHSLSMGEAQTGDYR